VPNQKARVVWGKEKEPNGRKPNGNHHREEENYAAFGPIHTF
jgi:hypothetical protein